jgi:hypothetical protein
VQNISYLNQEGSQFKNRYADFLFYGTTFNTLKVLPQSSLCGLPWTALISEAKFENFKGHADWQYNSWLIIEFRQLGESVTAEFGSPQ